MDLNEALACLQDELATIDFDTRVRPPDDVLELLIKQHQNIRLRMDGNKNHKRPHIHIDYGRHYHVASYAIDDGERLAGDLDRKYHRCVRTWISTHQALLLEAWRSTQAGQQPDEIIAALKGSPFG